MKEANLDAPFHELQAIPLIRLEELVEAHSVPLSLRQRALRVLSDIDSIKTWFRQDEMARRREALRAKP